MAEILRQWVAQRDPSLPPFFVEVVHIENARGCRLAGTFRTGATSLLAVPTNVSKRWNGYLSQREAAHAADYLNQLHADGRIDWKPEFPVIFGRKHPKAT
jgi:hypothetical protein